jgi:hypothetical protein
MNVAAPLDRALEIGNTQLGGGKGLTSARAEGTTKALSLKPEGFSKWLFSASATPGPEIPGGGSFTAALQPAWSEAKAGPGIRPTIRTDAAIAAEGGALPNIAAEGSREIDAKAASRSLRGPSTQGTPVTIDPFAQGTSQRVIETANQEKSDGRMQAGDGLPLTIADVVRAPLALLPSMKKGEAQVTHSAKKEKPESSAQKSGLEPQTAFAVHSALETSCELTMNVAWSQDPAPPVVQFPLKQAVNEGSLTFSSRTFGGSKIHDSAVDGTRQGASNRVAVTENTRLGVVGQTSEGAESANAKIAINELQRTSHEDGPLKAEIRPSEVSAEIGRSFSDPEMGTSIDTQDLPDVVPATAMRMAMGGVKGSHTLEDPGTSVTSEKPNADRTVPGMAHLQTSQTGESANKPTIESEQETARKKMDVEHRDGADGPGAQVAHVASAQTQSGIDELSAMRAAQGVHGIVHAASEHANGSIAGASNTAPGTAARYTFAALDSGSSVGAPNWIHAGGRQAEAGFQDPALGWVGVRADLSGGSVHAAVIPASAEAAQVLSTHLQGLGNYLAEQHTPASVTISNEGESGLGPALDQGQRHGPDQQQRAETPANMQSTAPGNSTRQSSGHEVGTGGVDMIAPIGGTQGTHISVMA